MITHSPGEIAPARTYFTHVAEGGVERCTYCMPSENDLPIYVLADPKDEGFSLARVWPLLKHYD